MTFTGDEEEFPAERDGRDAPMVVRRGTALQMWYVGIDGARRSLMYALSGDGLLWQRWGRAMSASSPWESGRILDPSVLYVSPSLGTGEEGDDPYAYSFMFYAAGAPGRERVGIAFRIVPPRP